MWVNPFNYACYAYVCMYHWYKSYVCTHLYVSMHLIGMFHYAFETEYVIGIISLISTYYVCTSQKCTRIRGPCGYVVTL